MGKPQATVRPQTAGASPFSTKVSTDCIIMCPYAPQLSSSYLYHPQMRLQEGNVFTCVCLFGGGEEHQMQHGIGHMVGYPLLPEKVR